MGMGNFLTSGLSIRQIPIDARARQGTAKCGRHSLCDNRDFVEFIRVELCDELNVTARDDERMAGIDRHDVEEGEGPGSVYQLS